MNTDLIQKLPPHSPEAERGFVGASIQWGEIHDDAEAIGFKPGWIYEERLRVIYEAAHTLAGEGAPVDVVTVSERLRFAGQLDAVGGLVALSELAGEAPALGVAQYWLPVIRDRFTARRLVADALDIAAAAQAAGTPAEIAAALELAESRILGIADSGPQREVSGEGLARLATSALKSPSENSKPEFS